MTVPVTIGLAPIELRPSLLESLSYCPARQRFVGHPDYDSTPSEAMSWGSLMHALVEPNFTVVSDTVVSYTSAEILEKWRQVALDDGFVLDEQSPAFELQQLALEAKDAYRYWTREVWPHVRYFKVLGVEQTLRYPLGTLSSGREVILHGTPDLVVPGELHDWKTGGNHYDQGKADSRPQGIYYAWLAEQAYDMRFVRMTYWSFNRRKATWVPVVQEFGPDNIKAAVAAGMEWAGMIESGYYPPTPSAPTGKSGRGWWCGPKYCNAWELCEFKGIIADGADLNAPRQKGWPS